MSAASSGGVALQGCASPLHDHCERIGHRLADCRGADIDRARGAGPRGRAGRARPSSRFVGVVRGRPSRFGFLISRAVRSPHQPGCAPSLRIDADGVTDFQIAAPAADSLTTVPRGLTTAFGWCRPMLSRSKCDRFGHAAGADAGLHRYSSIPMHPWPRQTGLHAHGRPLDAVAAGGWRSPRGAT